MFLGDLVGASKLINGSFFSACQVLSRYWDRSVVGHKVDRVLTWICVRVDLILRLCFRGTREGLTNDY